MPGRRAALASLWLALLLALALFAGCTPGAAPTQPAPTVKADVAFEFNMANAMVKSVNAGDRFNVKYTQSDVDRLYPPGQLATFLTKHDMDRVRSRIGDDKAAAVAASLYLLYPGVPFIYYGEEIGMQGVKQDEDIRLPNPLLTMTPRATQLIDSRGHSAADKARERRDQ